MNRIVLSISLEFIVLGSQPGSIAKVTGAEKVFVSEEVITSGSPNVYNTAVEMELLADILIHSK
jgi:hypothetical protein